MRDEGAGLGDGLDESMSRAEMVEAWRERRGARRQQTSPASDAGSLDGFALRRWRRAGVFGGEAVRLVEGLLSGLVDADAGGEGATGWAAQTLRQCLDGDPVPPLPGAIRAVLETLDGRHTVTAMTIIHKARLPWLTPSGEQWLAQLMSTDRVLPERDLLPTASQDPSGAFAIYFAVRGGQLGVLPTAVCDRILPWIPLGIIDDLIDVGAMTRDAEPWGLRSEARDRDYLLARLAPETIEPHTALALGWEEPVQRRSFLEGQEVDAEKGSTYDLLQRAADGDATVLKELENVLPRPLVLRLRHIQDGALTGNWDPAVLSDTALWRLMAALWEPRAAVNPTRSPFHALIALRHAYDVITAGDLAKARAQVSKLVAHEEGDPRHLAEARNMRAYLALLDDDLDTALLALTSIADGHAAAESNLELIKRRRAIPRNDRPHPSNPYLELGLPNGSPHWKTRYRDLRREYADDREEAARLNRAMRRIQQAEQAEDWSEFFVLPLDRDAFELPSAPPVTLVPPVEPMPRQTAHENPADLETVRDRAVADLLPTLLNAPRRPDHQHRTTA